MNKLLFLCCLLTASVIFPQNAQDYFPQQPGFKWSYKVTPLDSLSNPVDSLSYYQIDTFTVASNYRGKLANIVLSKSGTSGVINTLPYLDSSFISLSSSDANVFFKIFDVDSSFSFLDSTLLSGFQKYEGWYDVYRFAQPVNQQYTIFTKDTTITYDTLSAPLRFEYKVKRVNDQTITTELGQLNCKKFVSSQRLSYLAGISPFIIPVKIIEITDTSYYAPGYWLVKSVRPTAEVDLSLLNYGVYYINGAQQEIIASVPTAVGRENNLVSGFVLCQNYPNPFNPSTIINFSTGKPGFASLKVYDILGRERTCLVNKYLPQGNYSVSVDASAWASGVYIYTLEINGCCYARKMMLQK
jgi:hypothetical protein